MEAIVFGLADTLFVAEGRSIKSVRFGLFHLRFLEFLNALTAQVVAHLAIDKIPLLLHWRLAPCGNDINVWGFDVLGLLGIAQERR